MNHLHVRCPSCAKLYQIDVSAIFSTSPYFQCLSCPTRFTFEFPPPDPERIATTAIPAEASAQIAQRKCPKCGKESPKTAEECHSCHVLFEKLEGLPPDNGTKTQPSLVRRWKILLEDYGDENRHQDFLMACRDLDALEFARLKYEHIRQIQGRDDTADRMLARVAALKSVAAAAHQEAQQKAPARSSPAPWVRFALAAPFVISFFLILWGVMHRPQRNMIGTGIAVAFLSYGLITGFRGKLRLKDFLNP